MSSLRTRALNDGSPLVVPEVWPEDLVTLPDQSKRTPVKGEKWFIADPFHGGPRTVEVTWVGDRKVAVGGRGSGHGGLYMISAFLEFAVPVEGGK